MNQPVAPSGRPPIPPRTLAGLGALTGVVCLWWYWPTVATMAHRWGQDPQYSHGYLVPLFAAFLLWMRRDRLKGIDGRLHWAGVALVAAGAAVRVGAQYVYPLPWLDAASLVPCVLGVFVLFGGRAGLRWAWPAAAFLLFMVPLPYRVETALAHPLQRAATLASTYVLQTVGMPAFSQGNTILLPGGPVGVVEACSGLSMLLIFFALATAVAVLSNRPLIDRLVVLASAAPIAVVANVARISATGMAQEAFGAEAAHRVFHEWAGWMMMPLALVLLGAELWLMARLLPVEAAPVGPAFTFGKKKPAAAPAGPGKGKKMPRGTTARKAPVSPMLRHG